jgi:hypothetical protein
MFDLQLKSATNNVVIIIIIIIITITITIILGLHLLRSRLFVCMYLSYRCLLFSVSYYNLVVLSLNLGARGSVVG